MTYPTMKRRISENMMATYSFRDKIISILFTCGLLVLTAEAHAANITCSKDSKYSFDPPTGEDATLAIAGNISVGADMPMGSVIYTATYTASRQTTVYCYTDDGSAYTGDVVNIPYVSDYSTTPNGVVPGMTPVTYKTNIEGVGVRIETHRTGKPATALPETGTLATKPVSMNSHFIPVYRLYLIKTGNISPGVINGSSFPGVSLTFDKVSIPGYTVSGFPIITHTLKFIGQINVVVSTCNIDVKDVFVPMGKPSVSSFSGINSATEWKDASIRLSGCTSFSPGYYDQPTESIVGSGTFPVGTSTQNQMTLKITPVNGVENSNDGIIALDDVSNSASGVGIQIGYQSNAGAVEPLSLSTTHNLPLPSSQSLEIPLKARYIQTKSIVTPGVANGKVTYLINYK